MVPRNLHFNGSDASVQITFGTRTLGGQKASYNISAEFTYVNPEFTYAETAERERFDAFLRLGSNLIGGA